MADKNGRNYFGFVSNPRIQFKYAFLNSLFVSGVILLTNLIVVYRLRSFASNQGDIEVDTTFLYNLTDFTIQLGLITFLVSFIVTFFSSLVITHRFVGPFISINRYVEALINDKYDEPLNLRTSDEMHEVAGKLKTLGEKLKSKN